jgi:hypothetical protein
MTIIADSSLLTDGIFSALIVITVYLAFFQSRIRGMRKWFLAGIILAVATMIRPIAEFLILVIPVVFILRDQFWIQGERPQWYRTKMLAAFFFGCALILTPWMVRNEHFFGSFEVTNIGANDLLQDDARSFLAWRMLAQEGQPIPAIMVTRDEQNPIFPQVDAKIASDLAALTPPGGDKDNYMGQLAVRYIMQDPIGYAYFDVVNIVPFFLSSSIGSYEQIFEQVGYSKDFYAPTLVALLNALHTIVHPQSIGQIFAALGSVAPVTLEVCYWFLVTALALFALLKRRRDSAVLLFALLVAYFALLTGPMGSSRYRIPAEPYLLILAAAGLQIAVEWMRKKWSRS